MSLPQKEHFLPYADSASAWVVDLLISATTGWRDGWQGSEVPVAGSSLAFSILRDNKVV